MVLCEISISTRKLRQGWAGQTHVPEQRQHLVVGGVIRDEEAQVGLVEDGSDPDQPGTATRDDSDVLPRVLASLSLAVVLVVHLGDGLAEGLDASGRGILSAGDGNVDMGGPLEAAFDVVLDLATLREFVSVLACRSVLFGRGDVPAGRTHLRSTLTQVGPSLWLFKITELACSLRAPDDTGRGPRGV